MDPKHDELWPTRVADRPMEGNGFHESRLVKGNTFRKLKVVIIALPWGKVLKHNGLLMEFFLNNLKDTRQDILEVLLVMWKLDKLSYFLIQGLIVLIPKFGNHSFIRNWHPITMFRNIYKKISKFHLPNIIHLN